MKLVFATRNAGKLRELRALVGGIEVVSLDEVDAPEVDEDAPTFAGNAIKKARSAVAATGLPALADDSGLEVDALAGAPGVHSARYAVAHDDAANNAKLLAALAGVAAPQRTARFRCALALVTPDGTVVTVDGQVDGHIADTPRGTGGFGYDPLFLVDEAPGLTMAELPAADKNRLSHRARAMAKMAPHLAKLTALT